MANAAPRMADAANDPAMVMAATGPSSPAEALWIQVQHLLSQNSAYRKIIADLRDKVFELETAQERTQETLHIAQEAIQIAGPILKKNKFNPWFFETALRELPCCTCETAPPSLCPLCHAHNDKNFHLKVHYSKKLVIMDDKRGVVFEATESARDARNKRRREEYARQKAKEQQGPSTVASASWSSASGSSGDGVSSPVAAAGQSMSDHAEDGGPPGKKRDKK